MRILMWFAIGFAAACVIAVYLLAPAFLWIPACVCIVLSAALFFWKPKILKIAAVIVLGCAVAFAWTWGYFQLFLQPVMELDGQKLQSEITVSDYSYETDHGIGVDGKLSYNGKQYRVRTYLNDVEPLVPGDRIKGEFSVRYRAYGLEGESTYLQGEGIFLTASVKSYTIEKAERDNMGSFPVRLRQQILQLLDRVFPEDTAGFAKALLLGDTSGLSYELSSAFSVSGIRHVVAVSGLHVSILFSVIYALCGRQRHLTAVIGIPLLILFAAVAGFTPSIVRACVMQVLIILSMLFGKEYDGPTSLGFSVLVLLAVNPLTVTSVGFQLSVACLVGILAFAPGMNQYLLKCKGITDAKGKGLRQKIARTVLTSISISISVWVVTAPLCAIYFGSVSVVSPITNLLTIWMVTFVFYMIMFACVMGAIWLPLGAAVGWLASWPILLIQWIADAISRVPFAAVYTSSIYIVMWLVFCYVLIGVFVLMKYRKLLLVISCMIIGLALSITASCVEERLESVSMTVLDVGQGQCIILKSQGRHYMVDCGGDEAADAAIEYLHSSGVFYLDALILTHYDDDHASGAPDLLTRIPAGKVYLPQIDPDNRIRAELESACSERIYWVSDALEVTWADMTLVCGTEENKDNESGICVLFQPENYDILITGDRSASGERALMERVQLPQIDILVAGHHGSASATGIDLLEATRPGLVVISVGADNPYGHPADALMERLELFGCRVMRTDLQGTIHFR